MTEDIYANPFNPRPSWGWLEDYCEPLCFDLEGKTFELVMDDGEKYALRFMSGDMLEWGQRGKSMRWDNYECLKLDDITYLVNTELYEVNPRTCVTLVLDLKANLVTAVVAKQGAVKNFPYVVTNEIIFGAIKIPGKPINKMRHGYTADLAGTKIKWTYTSKFSIAHEYVTEHWLRVSKGADPILPENPTPEEIKKWEVEKKKIEFYEIPVFFIKIREDVYLFSCVEESGCREDPTQCANSLLMLADINKVHDIGRIFACEYNENYKPRNFMFSAFGDFVQFDATKLPESPYKIY